MNLPLPFGERAGVRAKAEMIKEMLKQVQHDKKKDA